VGGNLLHRLYADRDPGRTVFEFVGGAVRTVGSMRRQIGQMARALQVLGIEKGDRVSFKLEKSEEVLVLAHACLQLGAILHPLNTAYTDTEISYLVGDATPKLLVCHSADSDRLNRQLDTRVVSLDPGFLGHLGTLAAQAAPLLSVCDVGPQDTAAILYTSGTTGKPKGACITHGNLVHSALALAEVWQLTQADRLLHALPLYHAHGLLTAVNSLLVARGSIAFLPKFEVADVLAVLSQSTIVMGVPTHYARLCKEEHLAEHCQKLRLAISGSAPLPGEVSERFFALTRTRIVERYGATETAIVTAVPGGVTDRTGWVGWPLPGINIRVLQTDGQRLSRNAIGSLETRGHNVFAGYWRRPDADAFTSDGWFATGDIAEIDATGCVKLLGRTKDLIITGGLNVYPKEVEDALDAVLPGGESAVFGVPHPDFGEAVVAAITCEGDLDAIEPAVLRALRQTLAAYKVPKRLISVASIPRNRMSKVLKNELRQAYCDLFTKQLN
jgi:malonyl-CoA/methylmalonyl-CoA synthetase